ncbi:MAG: hypothetical protein OXP10_03080, partial [Chloroflexota bacterium]|nr:hypothetical protein [Chloroflexota bacterium]
MGIVGEIEEALGNLYEYRFVIGALSILAGAVFVYVAYKLRWYVVLQRYPVASAVIGVPAVVVGLAVGWWM